MDLFRYGMLTCWFYFFMASVFQSAAKFNMEQHKEHLEDDFRTWDMTIF